MIKRIFGILCLVFGILAFIYPTVSSIYNEYVASREICIYTDNLVATYDYEDELKQARNYNSKLTKNSCLVSSVNDKKEQLYEDMLNVTDNGIMGFIELPKILQKLPIYHYTDEEALSSGIGHLHGSSLPVGGKGTNTVLTGHRGLPGNMLFTRLDEIEKGDKIYINVFNEKLAYEVTRIVTVLPDETDDIYIDPDKDLLTLITCTPYSINTHRLVITAERIELPEVIEEVSDIEVIVQATPLTRIYIALAFVILLIVGSIVKKRVRR